MFFEIKTDFHFYQEIAILAEWCLDLVWLKQLIVKYFCFLHQ